MIEQHGGDGNVFQCIPVQSFALLHPITSKTLQ
jgi:hypothetical protein